MVDTSGFTVIQRKVPVGSLWELFETLKSLLVDGRLTFPELVHKELVTELDQRDVAAAWVAGLKGRRPRDRRDPAMATVSRLLRDETVRKVLRKDSIKDEADPWVLALACDLRDAGHTVEVFSNDINDKLDGKGNMRKASIRTCCNYLGLTHVELGDFIGALPTLYE